MRLKIILIFVVSILIPTALLSYFGLLAVRSEKLIIAKSMQARYEFMADIVSSQIKQSLAELSSNLLKNDKYLESILLAEAAMFKDQVKILNPLGLALGGAAKSFASGRDGLQPVLKKAIPGLSYTIAVYETYPLAFLEKFKEKKQGPYFYITIIIFSALSIVAGAAFALAALSRQWRNTELKSEFVSALSHDLRKPLTSIRMFSEMLKDKRVGDQQAKEDYYKIINTESERLTQLANNILDFSRIERGRKKYEFKPENIANIATDTVDHFKAFMAEKACQVNMELKDDFPPLNIDPSSISQALMNLLANAAKFSPPDKEIKVNLLKDQKNVIIEVIDQGIGIPKNEQMKIFQRFYRSSQRGVKDTEGSGLGLTLVKHIARAHNGRVAVESEEGKGSKFSLILPIS